MSPADAADSGAPGRSFRGPKPWALALRPFGYLLVGLVWLAIWAFCFAGTWFLPAFMVFGEELFDTPVTLAETFAFFDGATSSVGAILAMLLIVLPLVLVLIGPVVMWWLNNCTWPLAALSFVYVARSLRPSYAGERLSFTSYAPAGSTLGPPTVSDVALSLQPVRLTRPALFLMRFYMAGWRVNLRSLVAMLPASAGWLLVLPAAAADVPPAVRLLCGVLAVAGIAGGYAWATRITFRRQRTLGRP